MNNLYDKILRSIEESRSAALSLVAQSDELQRIVEAIVEALRAGGKVMFAGNGGSAGDAQHASAEFVGRLGLGVNRQPLPAIALTTDTSAITAIANDFGFEEIFSRQIEALARAGDVFVCMSTSGESPNIIRAVEAAKLHNCATVALTGPKESTLAEIADYHIAIDGPNTPRIQEGHALALHIICECTEIVI
ncbi:MAG TPA: SIS domain-containing protein [candidate division Zixibacteria bacterium]|nr:SIS domain-containing protein [candidate division Zixibacteria bacterium]